MMELRRLREREGLSILNQSPKRVSLKGRSKACYLRWCPGSRVGATESVPADGNLGPIYTPACRRCLRQWAPRNLLRHWPGSWMNEGGKETERGGADRRGFSRRAYTRVKAGWRRALILWERRRLFLDAHWIWMEGGRRERAEARCPVMMTGFCGGAEDGYESLVSWLDFSETVMVRFRRADTEQSLEWFC